MTDVINAVKNDLKDARTLCKSEFRSENDLLIAIIAGLLGDERRKSKKVVAAPATSRVRVDPVEVARKNPRQPSLPARAIASGSTKPAPAARASKPATGAKVARPRKRV